MQIAATPHKELRKIASVLAVFILIGLASGTTKADPLFFSNVVALQNGNSTKVDLFSNPGTTLLGSQLTFNVDVTGTLGMGGTDQLRITYNEAGSQSIVQTFSIPIFDTVQPPFTLLFSFVSSGANFQGVPVTLTVDLLNSSPDFVIPGGPNQGQIVNSYTYSFNVAQPVPEPSSMVLLATALAGVTASFRRKGREKKN